MKKLLKGSILVLTSLGLGFTVANEMDLLKNRMILTPGSMSMTQKTCITMKRLSIRTRTLNQKARMRPMKKGSMKKGLMKKSTMTTNTMMTNTVMILIMMKAS